MARTTEQTAIVSLERVLHSRLEAEQIVYVDFEERVLSLEETDDIFGEPMTLEEFLGNVISYRRGHGSYQAFIPAFEAVDDGMVTW